MHSGLRAIFIGGTVMMSMLAAAFVAIREAEVRAAPPCRATDTHSSTLG